MATTIDTTARRRRINDIKQALSVAREQEQSERVEDLLARLGSAYQENGQPKLAIGAWQEALSLAQARKAALVEAQLSEHIGQALLGMKHTQKAYQAYQRAFDLHNSVGDFEKMLQVVSQMAYIDAIMGFMDNAQGLFRQVRSGYRKLGDTLLETVNYTRQAEVFWQKGYQQPEALGLLRYALELFEQLLAANSDPMEDAMLAQEQQKALALYAGMLAQLGEDAFQILLQESALPYQRARLEAEVDRNEEHRYGQDHAGEIERLGYLRHDHHRSEPQAQPAVSAILEHGMRLAACPFYQEHFAPLRRAHNRLAEAILRGTVLLIEQVAEGKHSRSSDEKILTLYHQSGDTLGMARTFYNRGVALALSQPPQIISAYACAFCAMSAFDLLAQQDVQTRARKLLSSWQNALNVSQVEEAQKQGQALLEQYMLKPREIGIYRGPKPKSMLDSVAPQQRYATESQLLQATELVFSEMLREVQTTSPVCLEWNVYEEGTLLHSETTGSSLANDPLAQRGLFRLQYVTLGTYTFDGERMHAPVFSPLSSRTDDGFEPGIQTNDTESLLRNALYFLDREYTDQFDARGIEVLDAQESPVLRLAWHRNILGTSWRQ
jgi:tetratricopeptide (TPR) repeat protein